MTDRYRRGKWRCCPQSDALFGTDRFRTGLQKRPASAYQTLEERPDQVKVVTAMTQEEGIELVASGKEIYYYEKKI